MSDLVARLRLYVPSDVDEMMMDEAADRIEALEALVQRYAGETVLANTRIEELETALRFYACDGHWMLNGQCNPNSSRFEGPNIARTALDKDTEQ